MLRRQLRPTLAEAARAAQLGGTSGPAPSGSAGLSVPAGRDVIIRDETSKDVVDVRADGRQSTETRVTSTPEGGTRLSDVATRVKTVESAVKNLQSGVSTQGRWNTVATEDAPSSVDGYPDGAWWTKVASADDMTPVALWTVEAGKWVTKPLPAGHLIAPYLNTGVISAGTVAAAIIKSNEFWTALSGARVGFNRGGFQAYDADGNQTVKLDGASNRLDGTIEAGPWTLTSIDRTAGFFANHGKSADDKSPGLVQVKGEVTSGWENFIQLRSQVYGDKTNGATGDEHVNSYCMARSSTLDSDGTVKAGSQGLIARNVGLNDSQTLYLASIFSYLDWRSKDGDNNGIYVDGSLVKLHKKNNAGSQNLVLRDGTIRGEVAQGGDTRGTLDVGTANLQLTTRGGGGAAAGLMADSEKVGLVGPVPHMNKAGGYFGNSSIVYWKLSFTSNFDVGLHKTIGFDLSMLRAPEGCHYWPVSLLIIDGNSFDDFVCKIQGFDPDTSRGQIGIYKTRGKNSSDGVDIIMGVALVRSHDWEWQ